MGVELGWSLALEMVTFSYSGGGVSGALPPGFHQDTLS